MVYVKMVKTRKTTIFEKQGPCTLTYAMEDEVLFKMPKKHTQFAKNKIQAYRTTETLFKETS